MNVLMISLDSTLMMDKERVIEDTQDRHILYGEYVSQLFIVVRSGKGLKARKLSDKVTVYPAALESFLFVWDAYRISSHICRGNKIDVITTQDPLLTGLVGYLIRRRFKIPLNVQLHGNYLNNDVWLKQSKLNYLLNILGNYIVKRADSIRVVANRIGQKLALKLNIPAEKFITLPVPTNVARFINYHQGKNFKEKFTEFENVILFVGRLSKEKNVEALLVAAQKLLPMCPETLFLIIGDGPRREDLQKFAKQLEIGQNIRFEGSVSYKDVLGYYYSCDILVLPSKHEGWGRVAIEGLACGKPVIVSDACGVAELVLERECGFTFPYDRPDILAEKIMYLFENPKIREEMGVRGREYVKETLDIEKNAPQYAELYCRTVELAGKKCHSG